MYNVGVKIKQRKPGKPEFSENKESTKQKRLRSKMKKKRKEKWNLNRLCQIWSLIDLTAY